MLVSKETFKDKALASSGKPKTISLLHFITSPGSEEGSQGHLLTESYTESAAFRLKSLNSLAEAERPRELLPPGSLSARRTSRRCTVVTRVFCGGLRRCPVWNKTKTKVVLTSRGSFLPGARLVLLFSRKHQRLQRWPKRNTNPKGFRRTRAD